MNMSEILKSDWFSISVSKRPDIETEFKHLAQQLSMLLATDGIRCKPYVDGLPHFSQLSFLKQEEVVRSLRFYVELCSEQVSEGYRLSDNLSFTWKAFRKLDLVPRSDLFNYITDEDVIEIYSNDNRQLYRNLRFYDHCSYTLEELYSLEWWTLFSRDQDITMKIFDAAAQVLNGETEDYYKPDIPRHVVREVRSEERLANTYELRLASPLSRNRRVEALISVVRLTATEN